MLSKSKEKDSTAEGKIWKSHIHWLTVKKCSLLIIFSLTKSLLKNASRCNNASSSCIVSNVLLWQTDRQTDRKTFFPAHSWSRLGTYCHSRCIPFSITQLGEMLSQFVCPSKVCQFYVFCVDELLKLYFPRIRKSVFSEAPRNEYVAVFSL